MEAKVLGRVRKALEIFSPEPVGRDTTQLALSPTGDQLVSWGTPPYQEIVKEGRSFWMGTTAAVAAVVAIPSTAHMFAIYNNESDGGRSYVIDSIAVSNAVSTAVASQAQMLVNIGQVRETAPTDAGLIPKKNNGNGNVTNGVAVRPDTKAICILAATALPANTGFTTNWQPVGPNGVKPGVAATPGYGMFYEPQGRFIVPPGRYFAVHVLANVVGETFQAFISWHERQITLG